MLSEVKMSSLMLVVEWWHGSRGILSSYQDMLAIAANCCTLRSSGARVSNPLTRPEGVQCIVPSLCTLSLLCPEG